MAEAPFALGQRQLVQRGQSLQYQPCPASLPAGCEMAVLEGSPKGEGLFTLRIRASQPFVLPPHTHPQAERVTVLDGKLHVGFGTKVDKSASEAFGPGDYYVNAPGVPHFVWSDGPASLQITGFGPWKMQLHREQVVPRRDATPHTSKPNLPSVPPSPLGGPWGMEREARGTPPEVQRELEHMRETYERLPALRRLPDFLSVDVVLALMPESAGEREGLRESIHAQLEGGEGGPLFGLYLDEGERLFALWLGGSLEQVLAVYNGGRLTGKSVVSRGRPLLGRVLAEADADRPEILIERITSMSVCCHPMSLDVMRVSKQGALTRVLTFPKGHAEVGPGVRWSFLNHFEFNGDRVVITRAYPSDGPSYEFVHDKRGNGNYQPTPATAKRLADERREHEKLKAAGQLLGE